jgi:hypothetical protein
LKNSAFIVLLFSCTLSWTQNFVIVDKLPEESDIVFSEKGYNELVNYSPKAFASDLKSKPKNRMLEGDLNSIGSLELRYAYQQQLKLNELEIQWLEKEIEQLSLAFFTEKKPIIIQKTGDYEVCKDKGIGTEVRNGFTVTILKFCYTFPGASNFEDRFLQIFNNKTKKLISSKK